MIISGHQPVFLPNSRLFYKMAKSDILDLRITAQYTEKSYQRRVKMRDAWCTLPLQQNYRLEPLTDIRIKLPEAKETIRRCVDGRYRGAPHFKARGKDLLDKIDSIQTDYLWQFNLDLLIHVRDLLGIETPIAIGVPTIGDKAEGVLSTLRAYPGVDTYLSGTGAQAYMADTTVFDEAGIKVEWSRHKAVTNDSILSILMDYEDPMEIVMMEHDSEGEK